MRSLALAIAPLLLLLGCAATTEDEAEPGAETEDLTARDIVFSPAASDANHLTRIAKEIDDAKSTLDIAIYSFSDAGIKEALGRAVARGVKVRLVFNEGGAQERMTGTAKSSSMSGQLEALGVDVRFVNKIMHHKFMIVDGPRDEVSRAKTARLVTGSANWSSSAATKFDENTLFIKSNARLVTLFQRDFDTMWSHSRDFVGKPLAQELSSADLSKVPEKSGSNAFFTSANFSVKETTFSTTGENTVANALVAAIAGAQKSIHLASGHLRSRPVSEALVAKKKAAPDLDIRVYLDGQEYISETSHDFQVRDVQTCLVKAGDSESKKRSCLDKGFLFGHQLGTEGIDVRYKYYAYRWDYTYAPQMHHKYMVIDAKTLYTGSYNLSDNAEHDTFENMVELSGRSNASVVKAFEANFEKIWNTGRDEDKLATLTARIADGGEIPIVFDSMALTGSEISQLKTSIKKTCPAVDSTAYRQAAASHKTCR